MKTITAEETAQQIISNLTGYAAEEAKIWHKGDKCRIYFGRQFIAIRPDGTVDADQGSNPYGVFGTIEEMGITVS